jgi:outer membrane protein assembly factor BamC
LIANRAARLGRGAQPLETLPVTRSRLPRTLSPPVLALVLTVAGCSAVENFVGGDKVDYRTAAAKRVPLDVPPDLSQLARDSRYQTQGGAVSAAAFQAGASAVRVAAAAPAIAPQSLGGVRVEREGNQRWLSTPLAPEQLWPQLQAFWKENGFNLVLDEAGAGVMETDWAENRAKLPDDLIRRTLGRLVDSLYSTSERDKYRTRLERSATGTEIYISHRGLIEVYTGQRSESTVWQPRPTDPELEATFLARLMLKLGLKEDQAKAAIAQDSPTAQRARLLDGRPAATLEIDDGFDRAWRRVGLALDRSGFTVEDRDRAQGLYFVRYVDPALAGKEEPGFFAKLFSSDKGAAGGPKRFRIAVKSEGAGSTVSVLDTLGAPENGEIGKRIVALLFEDLK